MDYFKNIGKPKPIDHKVMDLFFDRVRDMGMNAEMFSANDISTALNQAKGDQVMALNILLSSE